MPVDILNLFIEFPGDMLFFLLVIAFSQGSLFLAFGHRSRFPLDHSTRRYVTATAALVLVWLVMLGAAAVSLYAELDPNQFMPPLERLAYAVSLLLLGWAFLSADFINWRSRSNLLVFGAAFLLTLVFINTARGWLLDYEAGLSFNASDFAPLWTAIAGCIAAAALLLTALNTRHIVDAPLKALFFLLFVAGSAWDLLQIAQGEVSGHYHGAARLAYAGGMILLPVIIHRLAIALLENSLVEVVLAASQQAAALPAESPRPVPGAPRDGLSLPSQESPRLLAAIGVMLAGDSRADAPMQVVKGVLAAIPADICLLLRLPNDNAAELVAGWDANAERALEGVSLNLSQQPTILSAAKRGDATTLLPDHHTDELQDLFQRLGVSGRSSVTVQPVDVKAAQRNLLLVGSPHRQTDLSDADLALLRDLAVAAGHVLAHNPDEDASPPPQTPAAPVAGPDADVDAPSPQTLLEIRREVARGLRGAAERVAKLREQVGGLEAQLESEQSRLLERLADDDAGPGAGLDLQQAFCERERLRVACLVSARELLDAEAALRLVNGSESLEHAAQAYLHKLYNVLLAGRDQLRRQVSALMALRQAAPQDIAVTLPQQLDDEKAQLQLQLEQQHRRRDSIVARLQSLGVIEARAAILTAVLQSAAQRQAWQQLLAQSQARLDALRAERQALLQADAGDKQALEAQLGQLSADHEQLLESREEWRREKQELRSQLDDADDDKDRLKAARIELEEALADHEDRQALLQQRLETMTSERNNLLTIRDQLTAKVAELVNDEAGREARKSLERELTSLRETVTRLSQQREDLALDLSDARLELASAPPGDHSPLSAAMTALLNDLCAPIESLRDYVDLLLGESIGILGAAQLQLLRMAADEIAGVSSHLAGIRRAASSAALTASQAQRVDVAGLLDEIIADASARHAKRHLLLELNLDENLPPLDADIVGLRHMLSQLLSNACEVSPPGASVVVTALKDRAPLRDKSQAVEALLFRVRDAGGGISSADLPRVFARKYREAYPSIRGFGDSGVGMTLARAMARAQKGDIWVTSETGAGATFHLALPLQATAAPEA